MEEFKVSIEEKENEGGVDSVANRYAVAGDRLSAAETKYTHT